MSRSCRTLAVLDGLATLPHAEEVHLVAGVDYRYELRDLDTGDVILFEPDLESGRPDVLPHNVAARDGGERWSDDGARAG